MNNKKMTAQPVHSLGLMDKTLPLTVATPPQLRHRRHFHFNGMHFAANPLALHLARGIQDDAGDTRRWPKAYHNNNNNNKSTVQQQQSEQQLSGNDNNGHNRAQNWCDDDNKWLNYGHNYGNDCYRQNDYDKAGGGEDVYGGDTNNDYHDHDHDHDNQRVQQVMGKGSRQQLVEQDYANYKSNSNCNCNSILSNSNSNFETNSNSNLQYQQQQQVADIYHNYGYQQQKDYEQDRDWKQETERERERERDRECEREQRPRLYNRAAFRPFGQQHQQLLRMAGGFRAAALAAATGNGNGNGIGIGADQPQMDYITLTGFLLGYLTSNVLFFLCWYFSWLKGQVMRMRKHFLGQSNLWEFFDFEDTTRYSMQTKLLLAPIILVCSILYCVVNVLHLLIKLVRADVPRTVVDLVQRIAKSHWP
ncbi:transcription factor mef2A [Drosophila nasuta]|uniref:transcription factor mef2A n=1 Tax=Drosophila nasuta TaxID=42062 RepID=UPI00295E3B92|nr:transcription factor mef2A [Drosophila nasuta]